VADQSGALQISNPVLYIPIQADIIIERKRERAPSLLINQFQNHSMTKKLSSLQESPFQSLKVLPQNVKV